MRRLAMAALAGFLATGGTAHATPHTIEAPPRVMVFPFASVGDTGKYAWIGQGLQQGLIAAASRPGTVVSTPAVSATKPGDTPEGNPVETARNAEASIAVFGTFQVFGDDLKCSGQVVDVGTGRSLGRLDATGLVKSLFKIEDQLGGELDHALPVTQAGSDATAPTASAPASDADSAVSTNSLPVYGSSGHSYDYSTPSDTYYPQYYSDAYNNVADAGFGNSGGYGDYAGYYDSPLWFPFYGGIIYPYGYGRPYRDGRYGGHGGHEHTPWHDPHFGEGRVVASERSPSIGGRGLPAYGAGHLGISHGGGPGYPVRGVGGAAAGGFSGGGPLYGEGGHGSFSSTPAGVVSGGIGSNGFSVGQAGFVAPPSFGGGPGGGHAGFGGGGVGGVGGGGGTGGGGHR